MADVVIAGGGPAGATLALLLGRAGLSVELYEARQFPREKPCGEGIMPAGVAVLERLGLRAAVGGRPLATVRYHGFGLTAEAGFPTRGGREPGRARPAALAAGPDTAGGGARDARRARVRGGARRGRRRRGRSRHRPSRRRRAAPGRSGRRRRRPRVAGAPLARPGAARSRRPPRRRAASLQAGRRPARAVRASRIFVGRCYECTQRRCPMASSCWRRSAIAMRSGRARTTR